MKASRFEGRRAKREAPGAKARLGWVLRPGVTFGTTMAHLIMKKETTKTNEVQLLELLKKVLPKATHDANLAGKIYQQEH